jgi:hypothetical protein
MVRLSKSRRREPRGFESHPLRQAIRRPVSPDQRAGLGPGTWHRWHRSARGEVLEWSIRHVWRTCERKLRGFESHPLRQSPLASLLGFLPPHWRIELRRGGPIAGTARPPLDNFASIGYYVPGRARWGASGALYPQPATAGSNHLSRPDFLGLPSLSGVEDRVRRGRNVPNPARFGRKQRSALFSWVLSGCLVGAG